MKIYFTILFCLIFISSCVLFPRSKKNILINCAYSTNVDSMYNSVKEELDVYDIKPGQTIADIGFGTAWLEGMLLVKYDSLNILAEDIRKYSLKTSEYVFEKYIELRETPNTNQISIIKGNKYSTKLPKDTCDKVIVRETFHHFSDIDTMMKDISSILKEDGKLYITEPYAEKTYLNSVCKTFHYSKNDLAEMLKKHDLIFLDEHPLKTWPWWDDRHDAMVIYIFEKKKK